MMPDHNVATALRHHAAERPDAPALSFPSADYHTDKPRWDTWTYAELDQESDAYARGLAAEGVSVGQRVVLLFKPSLTFYAVIFGLFKLGAVPVLLDPGMGVPALLRCIARTKPDVVIAASPVMAVATLYRAPFASAQLKITVGARWFWGGPTLAACRRPAEEPWPLTLRHATDDAAILFTSGSTGTAKGVASQQAMFAAQVEALRGMFDFKPGQRDVQAFAGFAIFDLCLGHWSILPKMNLSKPATANPADIVAAIQAHDADVAFASPVVWQNVSRYAAAKSVTLPSLRILLTVGAPIPAYLHRRFREILPAGAQMWTPYGATEAMPIAWVGTDEILGGCHADSAAGAGTCVGRVVPGVDVFIVPITDDPMPTFDPALALPAGEVGEIVVGGDVVSPEYKDVPEANVAAKMRDGDRVLHRMGDLGRIDDAGRLWFLGRKAHRLTTPRGVVPAVPVEGVFNEHPDVFRTALVGVGPPEGEVPVLCVELEPGRSWSPELERAILALAEATPHSGLVQRALHHPGFPVDARHNSKIRREDLKVWATQRCPDLAKGAA